MDGPARWALCPAFLPPQFPTTWTLSIESVSWLAPTQIHTHAQSTKVPCSTPGHRPAPLFLPPLLSPAGAWLPATQTTLGMADPELQAGPGPPPPACQASQSLRARSPELRTVPALLRQKPPNKSAPPASSTTGRGRTTRRVQGGHCTPDDAAPHQPHPRAPHASAQAGRFLRSQMATPCICSPLSTHCHAQAGPLALSPKPDPDGDTSFSPPSSQEKLEVIRRKFTRKSRRVAEEGREKKKWQWHGNRMLTGHQLGAPVGGKPSTGRAQLGGLRSPGLGPL